MSIRNRIKGHRRVRAGELVGQRLLGGLLAVLKRPRDLLRLLADAHQDRLLGGLVLNQLVEVLEQVKDLDGVRLLLGGDLFEGLRVESGAAAPGRGVEWG